MKFRYSAYWRTWSLVLGTSAGLVTEIDLTPINSAHTWADWKQITKARVRQHRTTPGRGDLSTDELPGEVRALMVENLGEPVTAALLSIADTP